MNNQAFVLCRHFRHSVVKRFVHGAIHGLVYFYISHPWGVPDEGGHGAFGGSCVPPFGEALGAVGGHVNALVQLRLRLSTHDPPVQEEHMSCR